MTLERLELLRDRKEQPHKVVASLVGEEVGEIVFAILDPELVEQNVEALETLRGVDKATITALKKNGIETVGQLGKKDWYAISLLKGIGEKRAGRIHLAIRKLVRKRIAQR